MSDPKLKKIDNLLKIIQECLFSGRYRDTMHAAKREKERKIILPEIIHVLKTGRHEKSKAFFERTFNSWNYAIRGLTLDKQDLRVIVSFEEEKDLLIITVFYVEKRRK